MIKKYSLILGKDQRNDYFSAYYKSKASGYIIASVTLHSVLHQDDFHFTKSEIDDLKSQQPTEAMRKIIDLAKVEVQEPLYYMQSKRSYENGLKLFYTLQINDTNRLEDISAYARSDIKDFLGNIPSDFIKCALDFIKCALRPRSDWEPYLTPDRELVRYEPNEDE